MLIVGSGLSIRQLDDLDTRGWTLVALNQAWRFAPDRFHYLVHSPALAGSKRPEEGRFAPGHVVSRREVRPTVLEAARRLGLAQDDGNHDSLHHRLTGHLVHFEATYWVMAELRPKRIAHLGCDFDYSGPRSHYYGKGQAVFPEERGRASLDELFDLQQRFSRLTGIDLVNLSRAERSLLPYPRLDPGPWTVEGAAGGRAAANPAVR